MSRIPRDRSRSGSTGHRRMGGGGTGQFAKLHVGNLELSITDSDLQQYFSRFGQVMETKIIRTDSKGQQLRNYCYAFVTMGTELSAHDAAQQYSGRWKVSLRAMSEKDQQNRGQSNNFNNSSGGGFGSQNTQYQQNKRNFNNNSSSGFSGGQGFSSTGGGAGGRGFGQNPRFDSNSSGQSSRGGFQNQGGFNKTPSGQKPYQNFQGNQQQQSSTGFGTRPPRQPKTGGDEPKTLADLQILVRELWVGGLTPQHTRNDVQRIFGVYGEIESCNVVNKQQVFAYVKFVHARSASKAFQNLRVIIDQLRQNSPQQVKIFFSDPQRRYDIVGDRDGWQFPEDCSPHLFIGFRTPQLPLPRYDIEKFLRSSGAVVEIDMKVTEQKSFFVIKYKDSFESQKAWRFLKEQKQNIGDPNCEVAMILNPEKVVESNQSNQYSAFTADDTGYGQGYNQSAQQPIQSYGYNQGSTTGGVQSGSYGYTGYQGYSSSSDQYYQPASTSYQGGSGTGNYAQGYSSSTQPNSYAQSSWGQTAYQAPGSGSGQPPFSYYQQSAGSQYPNTKQ